MSTAVDTISAKPTTVWDRFVWCSLLMIGLSFVTSLVNDKTHAISQFTLMMIWWITIALSVKASRPERKGRNLLFVQGSLCFAITAAFILFGDDRVAILFAPAMAFFCALCWAIVRPIQWAADTGRSTWLWGTISAIAIWVLLLAVMVALLSVFGH